jgi:hypothetical protein
MGILRWRVLRGSESGWSTPYGETNMGGLERRGWKTSPELMQFDRPGGLGCRRSGSKQGIVFQSKEATLDGEE